MACGLGSCKLRVQGLHRSKRKAHRGHIQFGQGSGLGDFLEFGRRVRGPMQFTFEARSSSRADPPDGASRMLKVRDTSLALSTIPSQSPPCGRRGKKGESKKGMGPEAGQPASRSVIAGGEPTSREWHLLRGVASMSMRVPTTQISCHARAQVHQARSGPASPAPQARGGRGPTSARPRACLITPMN